MKICRCCSRTTYDPNGFCPRCRIRKERKYGRTGDWTTKRQKHRRWHLAYDGFWDNLIRALEEDR